MTDKMTLLIVDDRSDNLLVLSSLVKEYFPFVEIFTAASADDGIQLAIEKQIDGALIDVQMPGIDGIEMCHRIKVDPRTEQMAIILLTAHGADPALKARGLEVGADDFINRPFDNVEFVARVKVLLRVKRAERDLRDLNERLEALVKEKTRALGESEEKYRALYEYAPMSYHSLDVNGILLDVNPTWLRTLGYTRDEVLGKPFADFLHSDWFPIHEEKSTKFKRSGHVKDIYYIAKHKAGHFIDILLEGCISYRDDGSVQQTYCVFQDITAHKQAEAGLELLQSAVEQAAEAIVITDQAGLIQYVNPAFEQMTGYARSEALGQNPRLLKSDQGSVTFYKELWGTLLRGETWRGRFVNKKKDGTLYSEEATISPVHNAAGVTTNYIAVKSDITQALELEDQLRQSQKIQAVGQLAGGIAHDFNNILTVILGYGQIICRRLSPEDKTSRDLNIMIGAAKKAENLTRQLLAFSRRQVLEAKTIDLNLLVAGFKDLLTKLLRENIELKLCLSDLPVLVQADPTQAEQILVNLVVNARDAIGDKEGVISIEVVTSDLPSNKLYPFLPKSRKSFGRIMVVDSGCGIAPEIKAKIFDPFFTTKESGKGTGLGLSTVYGIVKQSAGYLFVDSVPGEGTIFSVYLPMAREVAEAVISQPKASTLNKSPKNILVIDDEEEILSILEQVLEHEGHTVFVKNNSFEALDLWMEKKDELDLVITDIGMPGMNGVDLVSKILAIKDDMKILFISGYSELHKRENVSAAKDLNFLQKPFSPGDILEKIDTIFYP